MKRKIIPILLFTVALLLILAFINFKSVISCITVGWSDFKEADKNVYIQSDLSDEDCALLLNNISNAKNRITQLFGSFYTEPIIIVCGDTDHEKKYGMTNRTGVTHKIIFLGTYIVLGRNGLNVDVISHELTHSELAYRIGGIKNLKVPTWFDEGLAMQMDYRPQYSENEWVRRTNNGEKVVEMCELNSISQFNVEEVDIRTFHYILAKHELKRWLGIVHRDGLLELIESIKSGENFYSIYENIEQKYLQD